MMVQAASVIPDVGQIQHHVVGELALVRHRPVLEPRQGQPVWSHRDRCGAVGKRRVDERGPYYAVLREPVVEIERGRDAVRQVRGQEVGLEADRWATSSELAERYSGVIDSVTAADGALVSHPLGKAGPRAPGVLVRCLRELPASGAARAGSRENQRAWNISRAWV